MSEKFIDFPKENISPQETIGFPIFTIFTRFLNLRATLAIRIKEWLIRRRGAQDSFEYRGLGSHRLARSVRERKTVRYLIIRVVNGEVAEHHEQLRENVDTARIRHRSHFWLVRQRVAGKPGYQVARYEPPLQARAFDTQEVL